MNINMKHSQLGPLYYFPNIFPQISLESMLQSLAAQVGSQVANPLATDQESVYK